MTKALFLLTSLFLLAACGTLPQNFGERLAYGYTSNSEVRRTAAVAVRSDVISIEQGEEALRITDTTRAMLDEAADGDERQLELVIELLERLQEFLE